MDKATNNAGAEFDITHIPDLWHVAMTARDLERDNGRERGSDGSDDILTVWHQAHAMRDELLSLREHCKDVEGMLSEECRRSDALGESRARIDAALDRALEQNDATRKVAHRHEMLLRTYAPEVDIS